MGVSAVIPCGGKGTRMGKSENKLFLSLAGECVLAHTLRAIGTSPYISEIIIPSALGEEEKIRAVYESLSLSLPLIIVEGGKDRQNSVENGVRAAQEKWVLVHDGARALLTTQLLEQVIRDAVAYGGAALGISVKDTLKEVKDGRIQKTVEREHMVRIQTPQVFRKEDLLRAYEKAKEENFLGTDECSLVERIGISPYVSEGSEENIKITTPDDLVIAQAILERRGKE